MRHKNTPLSGVFLYFIITFVIPKFSLNISYVHFVIPTLGGSHFTQER